MRLRSDDPLAIEVIAVIHGGDLPALQRLLANRDGLAAARIEGARGGSGTLLHAVASNWPGYYPNGPAIVAVLARAGAELDAPTEGHFAETPLMGAASNDDVEVARVLLDAGARLDVTGASIAGGTALDNAVGYGCWRVARLLVERGAQVDKLWQAAGLGMMARVHELISATSPSRQDLTDAFHQACSGGHRRVAELLLRLGADLNGPPSWGEGTPLGAATGPDTAHELLIEWLCGQGARPAHDEER
jgi:hypothetical protein